MKEIELDNRFIICQTIHSTSISDLGKGWNITVIGTNVPNGNCIALMHKCATHRARFAKVENGEVKCRKCEVVSNLSKERIEFMMKMIRINL